MPARGCRLADERHSDAVIARLRKKIWEDSGQRKPHGFKMAASCGNRRCIARAHLELQPWKMWSKNMPTPWGIPMKMNRETTT